MAKNPSHIHSRNADKEFPSNDRVKGRDLEKQNEARSAGLPGPEPRDHHKAGGGTLGKSLGGAHTGRYGAAPDDVTSNRDRKLRGRDKHEE